MVKENQALEFQKMQEFLDDMREVVFSNELPQSISNQILALTEEYRLWQILVNTPRSWVDEKTKEVLLRENNNDLQTKYKEYHELRIELDDSIEQWKKDIEKNSLEEEKEFYLSCGNSNLAKLIDNGFITRQILGISRLVADLDSDSISLRNMVNHIKKQQSFITREIFVCYDGAPYDYEEELQKHRDDELSRASVNSKDGEVVFCHHGRIPANDSKDRHEFFDRMSGVKKRAKDDIMSGEFFQWMERKLDNCQHVAEVAENVVIHQKRNPKETSVTFFELEECHVRLRKIYNTIALYFYNATYSPIVSGYGLTKNLDKPWIDSDRISEIHEMDREKEKEDSERLSKCFGGIK
ncbi:hypothetical protein LCGC14_1371700 [marine sediment metagenome]|uniref:HEPN AbiU2-like domain-containing protein n=1 Tax=marine sediment metagenome TaxID=412755 RepID=A0A0F9K5K3_9ZZZZ